MRTPIDPKVDYAFKHVFGREESKPALISLLDAVLQPAAGHSPKRKASSRALRA